MSKTGIEMIAQERAEQIEKHGYTVEKDVEKYGDKGLIGVAGVITGSLVDPQMEMMLMPVMTELWGIDAAYKIAKKSPEEKLALVGALVAAQIDVLKKNG